jgi:hypothetical protein
VIGANAWCGWAIAIAGIRTTGTVRLRSQAGLRLATGTRGTDARIVRIRGRIRVIRPAAGRRAIQGRCGIRIRFPVRRAAARIRDARIIFIRQAGLMVMVITADRVLHRRSTSPHRIRLRRRLRRGRDRHCSRGVPARNRNRHRRLCRHRAPVARTRGREDIRGRIPSRSADDGVEASESGAPAGGAGEAAERNDLASNVARWPGCGIVAG